jgi:hypothetical protein
VNSIPNSLLKVVKFFLKNGMMGIHVKLSSVTARRQVSVPSHCIPDRTSHLLQLLQPDVVNIIQEDLLQQLTKFSAMVNVARSAIGSVGRSLNL